MKLFFKLIILVLILGSCDTGRWTIQNEQYPVVVYEKYQGHYRRRPPMREPDFQSHRPEYHPRRNVFEYRGRH